MLQLSKIIHKYSRTISWIRVNSIILLFLGSSGRGLVIHDDATKSQNVKKNTVDISAGPHSGVI